MLRFAALFLALALSGLANMAQAQDGTSRLKITTDKMVLILVDGTMLEYGEGSTTAVADGLQPGKHEVSMRNILGTKEFMNLFVDVPAGHEVRCRYKHRAKAFDCYESVPMTAPVATTTVVVAPPPTTVTTGGTVTVGGTAAVGGTTTTTSTSTTVSAGVAGGPVIGGSVTVNETNGSASVGVNLGGLLGGGVTVTETTTTSTAGSAVVTTAPATATVVTQAVPSKVKIVIRSLDGEWADVVVDGKVELEVRNQDEGFFYVSPGQHQIEIREFMEDEPYTVGTLNTGYADVVTFGIKEGKGMVCYDHDGYRGM